LGERREGTFSRRQEHTSGNQINPMKALSKAVRFTLTVMIVAGTLLAWHGPVDNALAWDSLPGPADDPGRTNEAGFNIGTWFASKVWRHVSAVDGQRCPSEPTCSSYSAQAFRKHGFFIGWVMTVDRLIHEADEGRHSPLLWRDGGPKILDPVENNDFWWYGSNEDNRE